MISPRTPLIALAAVIVLPALTVIGVAPTFALSAVIAIAVVVITAVADAIFFAPRFDDLQIAIPEVVRRSKNRTGEIDFLFARCAEMEGGAPATPGSRELAPPLHIRVGLALPREVGAATSEFEIEFAAGESHRSLAISCQPTQRGRFILENAFVQSPTRFRLWNFRRAIPLRTEIRVYPDLLSERRHFAALFLRRGSFGVRQYRQVGKGREFEKLREYIPGDSADEIHWKATAKRSQPVTKVFQIERTQEVYVIVDASRLSARFAAGAPALERFINSALILCLAAAHQNDLFGLVTFSDRVHSFIRAKNGKAHYNVCRDALYTLQPELVTPDFEGLFTSLRLHLRRRALLIFLSALDDPALAESFSRHAHLLTRQHVVIAEMVRPPHCAPLFSNPIANADDAYQQLGGHLLWRELQQVQKQLERNGVEFALLPAEQLAAETVTRYLRVKQRQLL